MKFRVKNTLKFEKQGVTCVGVRTAEATAPIPPTTHQGGSNTARGAHNATLRALDSLPHHRDY